MESKDVRRAKRWRGPGYYREGKINIDPSGHKALKGKLWRPLPDFAEMIQRN